MADRQTTDVSGIGSRRRVAWACGLIATSVAFGPSGLSAADEVRDLTIRGTITVSDALAATLRPDDRLILKIFHPGADGYEKDTSYQIKPEFSLPTAFRIVPPIDMNANPRWPNYVVEVFIDRDHDVLSVVDGELFATTGEALTLGTHNVALDLTQR